MAMIGQRGRYLERRCAALEGKIVRWKYCCVILAHIEHFHKQVTNEKEKTDLKRCSSCDSAPWHEAGEFSEHQIT